MSCITVSLTHNPFCPLCRNSLSMKDITVIQNEKTGTENNEEVVDEDKDEDRKKVENLIKYISLLMNDGQKRKILIFSEYEYSFREIDTFLKENEYE